MPEAPPPVAHQRARGTLRISFKRRADGRTVLDGLRQEGCLKARFPRVEPDEPPVAVTLNGAGGVAGGDALSLAVTAGPGTEATVASQAAERVYRALPGALSTVDTALRVDPGAALEWLPQETILFDRCALHRRLAVDLAPDARFLGVESLVFGRAAMAEEVGTATLLDRITIRRNGRLVLHDAVRFRGPVAALLRRAAVGAGARAAATLVHVGPEDLTEPLRAVLCLPGVPFEAGVSRVNGVLLARIVAPTGAALRRAVTAGLNVARAGRTLPRVWMC